MLLEQRLEVFLVLLCVGFFDQWAEDFQQELCCCFKTAVQINGCDYGLEDACGNRAAHCPCPCDPLADVDKSRQSELIGKFCACFS